MHPDALEWLAPSCPACRATPAGRLRLASARETDSNRILFGSLVCDSPACGREFPIIDGVPLVLPQLRDLIAGNPLSVLAREDLPAETATLIGDCCGPDHAYEINRQQISSYVDNHYEPAHGPGALRQVVERSFAELGAGPEGTWLDVGCAVGGAARVLASLGAARVVAIDVNLAMIRVAARALRDGQLTYDRRRVGLAYERRTLALSPAPICIEHWAVDATRPPGWRETFDGILALNVLDSSTEPLAILNSVVSMLRPGGVALLTSPYDWSPRVTPLDHWLGGHSQRGPLGGDSGVVLRAMIAEVDASVEIVAQASVPWSLRQHERSSSHYELDMLWLRKGS